MRPLAATVLVALALVAGCGPNHVAEEDRLLTADHVANAAVQVDSRNGAIEVQVDPVATGVTVKAHVRAGGATTEVAAERLAQVVVSVVRDPSGSLVVGSTFPPPQVGSDGVSYVIVVPDASRADLRTSNGRIEVRGVAGDVVLHTSNGAVVAEAIAGSVEADSSNGRIALKDVKGGADVRTSNGAVEMQSVAGPIKAHSSNGRLELRDVGGPIQAQTSNGAVVLVLRPDFAGTLDVATSNGGMAVVGGPSVGDMQVGKRDAMVTFRNAGEASRVRTSNGSVRVEAR